MSLSRRVFLLGTLSAGISCARADAAPAAPTAETWSDGTRFVHLPRAGSPFVAFHVFFDVGQADETNLPGLCALLVRAWGRETESRSPLLLQNDIGAAGGALGASLDKGGDGVHIGGLCRSDKSSVANMAQTLFTDIVARPRFTPQTVEIAREILENDLLLQRDNLVSDVTLALRARIWDRSAYGYPPLGYPADTHKLKAEKLTQFYGRFFAPNRAVVVVAGNIGLDDARQTARASLNAGGWTDKSAPPRPAIPAETVPASLGVRPLILPRTAPATVVMAGALAPGASQSGFPALLVWEALLGGGKQGRIFSLRDELGLAYETRTALQPARAQSLLTLFTSGKITTDVERETIQNALLAVLRTPPEDLLKDDALPRAKTFLRGQHLRQIADLRDEAQSLAWAVSMGLGADWTTDHAAHIKAVTPDDVKKIAQIVSSGTPVVVATENGGYAEAPQPAETKV